jgi:hypothetical protein
MKPFFQDVIEQEFENALVMHPEYNDLIDVVLDSLRIYEGPDKEWFRDALFQGSENDLSRIDVHFYAKLIGAQCRNRLWWGTIDMRTLPVEAQKESLLNELSLADLPSPFSVEYLKINGERQAYLEWKEPIILENGYTQPFLNRTKEIRPDSAILTVGHTRALTTYLVLEETKFIARWPYGHRSLFLIHLGTGEHQHRDAGRT